MGQLTKDMAPVPQMWRMAMALRPLTVEVVLNPLLEDTNLVHQNLELNKSMEPLQAFEDMIYENPLLLSDFNRTSVIIDTPRFTIIPSEIKSDEVHDKIIHALWPDSKFQAIAQDIEGTDDTLLMAVDSSLLAFLQRTFLDAKILHPIAIVASYFSNLSRRGNTDKVYARLRPGAVDVVAIDNNKLRIANTFDAPSADDAAYYILAAAQTAQYNLDKTEFIVFGDASLRDAAMARMRTMASQVLPLVFPSELYRAGASIDTPLELLVV